MIKLLRFIRELFETPYCEVCGAKMIPDGCGFYGGWECPVDEFHSRCKVCGIWNREGYNKEICEMCKRRHYEW